VNSQGTDRSEEIGGFPLANAHAILHSVNLARLPLHLRRTLSIGEHDRIVAPSGPQISLDLFLSGARPRCVVPLCNADATVSEKYGNPIEWHASE